MSWKPRVIKNPLLDKPEPPKEPDTSGMKWCRKHGKYFNPEFFKICPDCFREDAPFGQNSKEKPAK